MTKLSPSFCICLPLVVLAGLALGVAEARAQDAGEPRQGEGPALSEEERGCLLEQIDSAAGDTTIEELRRRCGLPPVASESPEESAVEQRVEAERRTMGDEFVITPHRPNYVLPFSYNFEGNGQSLSQEEIDEQSIRDEELKFQLSLKIPLWRGLFSENNDLFFGFTLVAWWQAYAGDLSAPFRDINYEPELFLRHYGGPRVLGLQLAGWDIGLAHQSNGRGGDLSRTWDRVVGQVYFELGDDVALGVKGWYRIPEPESRDENPRIHRWLGYGQVRLAWAPGRHTFTAMVRPGTEEISYELTWSLHIRNGIRLYTQLFDGYGESLLDYDKRARRFGLGIAVSDYL